MNPGQRLLLWLGRTPVQTFILYPLAVVVFELALHRGELTITLWGVPLLLWGYLQYFLVGRYRHPRAGGSRGMEVPPERIITRGPYRFSRNPMYLGMTLCLIGAAICFDSVVMLIAPVGFMTTVTLSWIRFEEAVLTRVFGAAYRAYVSRVRRWL